MKPLFNSNTSECAQAIATHFSGVDPAKKAALLLSLDKLIRLAKAEIWLDIKRDVSIATGITQYKK